MYIYVVSQNQLRISKFTGSSYEFTHTFGQTESSQMHFISSCQPIVFGFPSSWNTVLVGLFYIFVRAILESREERSWWVWSSL